MLKKVNDVIFQSLWRHSCQFKPQNFSTFFWLGLVPPTLKKVLPPMGQAISTSVRPASTKDCTSGNETRTQNACASVPICIVSYSYTVIVPCILLYDVPINVAYKTLSKYFIQILSFVTLIHITQTASRVGPNYTLHSRN